MAGRFSNQKGKRGEREIAAMLREVVNRVYLERGLEPPTIYRNTDQSANGGYDIKSFDWLALEIKRQEVLSIPSWWRQTLAQAKPNQVPVLMYKQNRKKWRVVMYSWLDLGLNDVRAVGEFSIDDFLIWFERRIINDINLKVV